jgi:Domain of unknown function (DUF6916)
MSDTKEMGLVGLADFTADLFAPFTGQTLVFERPSAPDAPAAEPARMLLLEVKRGSPIPGFRRQPFSLLFVMKDQAPLGAGLHRLIHPGIEPSELLVSRVTVPKYQAQDPKGMYYEAVFG